MNSYVQMTHKCIKAHMQAHMQSCAVVSYVSPVILTLNLVVQVTSSLCVGGARQMLMDEYDIDGSGHIEFSEFESMVRLGNAQLFTTPTSCVSHVKGRRNTRHRAVASARSLADVIVNRCSCMPCVCVCVCVCARALAWACVFHSQD
jgi:hypothetical protein